MRDVLWAVLFDGDTVANLQMLLGQESLALLHFQGVRIQNTHASELYEQGPHRCMLHQMTHSPLPILSTFDCCAPTPLPARDMWIARALKRTLWHSDDNPVPPKRTVMPGTCPLDIYRDLWLVIMRYIPTWDPEGGLWANETTPLWADFTGPGGYTRLHCRHNARVATYITLRLVNRGFRTMFPREWALADSRIQVSTIGVIFPGEVHLHPKVGPSHAELAAYRTSRFYERREQVQLLCIAYIARNLESMTRHECQRMLKYMILSGASATTPEARALSKVCFAKHYEVKYEFAELCDIAHEHNGIPGIMLVFEYVAEAIRLGVTNVWYVHTYIDKNAEFFMKTEDRARQVRACFQGLCNVPLPDGPHPDGQRDECIIT